MLSACPSRVQSFAAAEPSDSDPGGVKKARSCRGIALVPKMIKKLVGRGLQGRVRRRVGAVDGVALSDSELPT